MLLGGWGEGKRKRAENDAIVPKTLNFFFDISFWNTGGSFCGGEGVLTFRVTFLCHFRHLSTS